MNNLLLYTYFGDEREALCCSVMNCHKRKRPSQEKVFFTYKVAN
jgi:hypothetical protein